MTDPTIDATVAGPESNSYVTLAFADAYFADTLEGREWLGFPSGDRARALISATRKIDMEFRFYGVRAFMLQALKFPRDGDYDADGNLRIPDGIEYAACELALHILRGSKIVAALTEGYTGPVFDLFPRRVRKLLRPFIDAALSREAPHA